MNIDITTKTLHLGKTHSTPHEGFIFVGIGCLFQDALSREDARGVAGAASATPKFGTLLNKLGSDILLHFFIYCLLHHFKIPTVLPTLSWVGVLFTTYRDNSSFFKKIGKRCRHSLDAITI